MKLAALKLYVQVIFSGLVLLAGLVLLVLQWGNQAAFSLYGSNRQVNTLLLMLCSAVGGVVAWRLMKVLWRGAIGIHKLRHPEDLSDQDAGCSAA
jgi:hypothetical protein